MNKEELDEMIRKYLENENFDDLDFGEDDIVSANGIIRPKNSTSSIPAICKMCDVFNYGMSAENCNDCEGPKSFF